MNTRLTLWAMLGVDGHTMRVDGLDKPSHLSKARVARGKSIAAATTGPNGMSAGALWCRGITGESKGLLGAFKPRPTLILKDTKTRWTAFWALSEPATEGVIARANEKLAYCLKGRKKDADPEMFSFGVGETAEYNPVTYGVEDVIFCLKDAPGWAR